jgi:hypothetical protein
MIATCDTAQAGVVSRSFRDPAGTVLRSAGRIFSKLKDCIDVYICSGYGA